MIGSALLMATGMTSSPAETVASISRRFKARLPAVRVQAGVERLGLGQMTFSLCGPNDRVPCVRVL